MNRDGVAISPSGPGQRASDSTATNSPVATSTMGCKYASSRLWRIASYSAPCGIGSPSRPGWYTATPCTDASAATPASSEELRVGKEWVSKCKSLWFPYHLKKQILLKKIS